MKARYILSVVVFGLVWTHLSGGNLLIYRNTGEQQKLSLSDVEKLTFTETEMTVSMKNEDPDIAVPFSELHYFSFQDTRTSIPVNPQANEDPEIRLDKLAGRIDIRSSCPILRLSMYSVYGGLIAESKPGAPDVSISTVSCPKGIYLLQITNRNGQTTKKILIR